jgi:peptidoglycan/xylan/chitin deacetylase (PgdA/CDA1 family)
MDDEELLTENTSEVDVFDDNRESKGSSKKFVVKKRAFMIISFTFVILIFFMFIFFYIFTPKLTLIGDQYYKLEYGEKYEEPGYRANYYGVDLTHKVYITGNVDETKLGNYELKYNIRKNRIVISKKRIVKVVDTKKPEITLKGDKELSICPEKEYKEEGYTAVDNYDGDLTKNVNVVKKNEEITYIAVDSSGNRGIVKRKLNREDKEAPKIELKGGSSMSIIINNSFNDPGYTATDNCDEDLTESVKVEGEVNTKATGTYELTYKVKDKAGNEGVATRKVTVANNYPRQGSSTGCGEPGTIYLTFDDGPNPYTTPKILDVLKKYGVKATFFVMGKAANSNQGILKREANEGHAIGLHSWTHEYGAVYKSSDAFWNEMNKTNELVKSVTGKSTNLIRYPGGASNTVSCFSKGVMPKTASEIAAKGYNYFDWNISSGDAGGTTDPNVEYNTVVRSLSKSRGNVILMHDIKTHTMNAIERIVQYGLNNGYKFDVLNTSISCKQAISKCHY